MDKDKLFTVEMTYDQLWFASSRLGEMEDDFMFDDDPDIELCKAASEAMWDVVLKCQADGYGS